MDFYSEYYKEISKLNYQTEIIGYTTLKYGIPIVHIGEKPKVLIVGGVHAREHITTALLLKLIASYHGKYDLDIIPCLNLDGTSLATYGLNGINASYARKKWLAKINKGEDFSLWKANANAVDINVNFDADWGKGKNNVFYPDSQNYVGGRPESENETQTVARLIRSKKYQLAVAYHSKGEEVYWGYKNNLTDKNLAEKVAKELGYTLKTTPDSCGGLKDYHTLYSGKLGLTIEVGSDEFSHPYPLSELNNLCERHKNILSVYGEIGDKLWIKYHS